MEFQVIELDPTLNRVTLSGRLDAEGCAKAELPFTAAVGSVGKHALLDLGAVGFVGSLGIRMLISVARVLHRKDRKMILYGVRPEVAEVFDTVALDQMIPIVATEAEARARIAA